MAGDKAFHDMMARLGVKLPAHQLKRPGTATRYSNADNQRGNVKRTYTTPVPLWKQREDMLQSLNDDKLRAIHADPPRSLTRKGSGFIKHDAKKEKDRRGLK